MKHEEIVKAIKKEVGEAMDYLGEVVDIINKVETWFDMSKALKAELQMAKDKLSLCLNLLKQSKRR